MSRKRTKENSDSELSDFSSDDSDIYVPSSSVSDDSSSESQRKRSSSAARRKRTTGKLRSLVDVEHV